MRELDSRRLIVYAYVCWPDAGSEPGAGWVWTQMLSRLGEVDVITQEYCREQIERGGGAGNAANANPRYVYVDFSARGRRIISPYRLPRVHYLLWQLKALAAARRMHRETPYDLAWHLTLSNGWLGSTAALVGPPFVYGPIGAGITPPLRLMTTLGVKGCAFEVARALAMGAGRYVNPLARLAWRRAAVILTQNSEARSWLPRRHRERAEVFSHVVFDSPVAARASITGSPQEALYVGRLLPWKGIALAIEAVARTADWRLTVCGTGPDAGRLERLARRRGVEGRVRLLGWQPREEVLRLMRQSSALLFPSLHDQGGWVVAEALAAGLPVVCLDHGGPSELLGDLDGAVDASGPPGAVAARLVEALGRVQSLPREALRKRAEQYSLEVAFARLQKLVQPFRAGSDARQ